MRPAALIFDVDGTLAETEEVHRRAFNDSFAQSGLDWEWDVPLYRRLLEVTGGKERIQHYRALRGEARLDAATLTDLHALKTRCFAERLQRGDLGLRPGIARLLQASRTRGLPVAIATTTSQSNVENLLTLTLGPDAIGWFAAIGAGDVVSVKKPAPDIYAFVLERLGLRAADCVALEDSRNGLDAALAAGVPTVVTISRFTDHQAFPGALSVLDHLGEPDMACTALAGRPTLGTYVTMADFERWLAPE